MDDTSGTVAGPSGIAPGPPADEVAGPDWTPILIGSFLFVLLGWAWSWDGATPSQAPPRIPRAINVNTAPWWELTLVPGIGPTTAQAIVDERRRVAIEPGGDGSPAFRSAADLDRVPGIGPATIRHIGPFLRFDAPPGDRPNGRGNSSPARP